MLHLAVVSLLKKMLHALPNIDVFKIFHYHIEQVRLYLASH